jgi:hypothetical protein
MKILFDLLLLSITAILIAACAMWWRLRRHLRHPGAALQDAVEAVQPEPEVVE